MSFLKRSDGLNRLLTKPIMLGLRVVAPLLIIGYILNMIITPVQKLLGGLTASLCSTIGVGSTVGSSPFTSLVLAVLLLFALGAFALTRPGRFAIGFIDRLLSILPVYKSVRKLVKLPSSKKVEQPGGDKYKGAVWVWQNGGLLVGLVRNQTTDSGGNDWLTVVFIGLPVPTSWTVRVVEAWRTADAGASAGAWEAWGSEMGAEFPEGFNYPPLTPPADEPAFPGRATASGA